MTEKEILRQYPTLKKQDIKAALVYASKSLENEETILIQAELLALAQLLIDENIPKDAEEWLSKRGFETVNVSKLLPRGVKDHVIVEYAVKNKLAIITLDKGFAQLYRTFQKGTPLTVIIVKANPPTPIKIIETLNLAQNKTNLKEIQNKLVIITKRKIRIIT